jgi:hypothetical protein
MAQTVLTATQQCDAEMKITDARGNPAPVQDPHWASSDETIVTVNAAGSDPLKALIKAVGPMGAALVTFTGDADLGGGVIPIIATGDFVVTAGQAVVAEMVTSEPTEQSGTRRR